MTSLSALIRKQVVDATGRRVGRLADVVVRVGDDAHGPEIVALEIEHHSGAKAISRLGAGTLSNASIRVDWPPALGEPFRTDDACLRLVGDVLDRRAIDLKRARVVRVNVNDIVLLPIEGRVHATRVDVGKLGLLRRLGAIWLASFLARSSASGLPASILSWKDVDLLPGDRGQDLSPTGMGRVLGELERPELERLIERLDARRLADTLQVAQPRIVEYVVDAMTDAMVADVLRKMTPDVPARTVARMPERCRWRLRRLLSSC